MKFITTPVLVAVLTIPAMVPFCCAAEPPNFVIVLADQPEALGAVRGAL